MQYSLSKDSLQTLLPNSELPRLDKLLLVLAWDSESPKTLAEIKTIASQNGLKEATKWNISDYLSKSKGMAVSIDGKWIIAAPGRTHILKQKYVEKKNAQLKKDVTDLRSHLSKVTNPNTKSFLEEAIFCLKANQLRAAVVFSWVGAVAILHDEVVKNHLVAFNTEATKRDAKWKAAKTADDIGKMKEHDFLNVLESISVIGKNVKQELQNGLQLRNGCGHPNTLTIGERKVAAHIEILILNVFSKF